MSLSLIIATRGRPHLLVPTIGQTLRNMRRPDTRLVVAIDRDDLATIEAVRQINFDERVIVSIREREDSLGEKYNRVLTEAPADVYTYSSDYAAYVTPGFDERISEAAELFPDGIGVVVNHLNTLVFPQIEAVTANLASMMGGFFPAYFPYWFIDHWLLDIADLIGRKAFAEVWVDTRGRPGTQDMREPGFWATFYDAGILERRRLAHSIIRSEEFLDPPWLKEIKLRHHPIFEERSRRVNNEVRAHGSQWSKAAPEPDDRYRRIKARALAKLAEMQAELDAQQEAA